MKIIPPLPYLLSAVITISCLHSTAQLLPLSIPAGADSALLQQKLQILAQQLIPLYTEKEQETRLDNLFRLQIVAGQYNAAVNTLDSLRELFKKSDSLIIKGIGFQFEWYARTRLVQQMRSISFEEALNRTFTSLYNQLPEKATANIAMYFETEIPPLKKKLDELVAAQTGKDSISITDARLLCRTYNSWNVYNKIVPPGKLLLTQQDNSKYIIEDSVMIPTRDGATVTAVVVRPKEGPAKLPAIFIFNIYTGGVDRARAKDAALNGYAGIVANTRGKKLSTQDIEPFEHDAGDAYDIINWISQQPWSNGKVGMYGGSYLGFSQWAAAKKVHPALKTIVPQVAVGIGIDYPMQNHVFMSYMLRWIHFVTNSKQTDETDFNNSQHWDSVFTKWYISGRSFRALDTIEGRPSKIFQRWLQHPSYDNYWQKMVPYKQEFADINIPILTTTGYYDDDQLGAMYYFNEHHRYHKSPNHYLLIGPYSHAGGQSIASAVLQGYTIDSVANISITDLTYKWFNYILKDSARPALLKDKINYQVMGGNEWKHRPSLSKMNNDTLTLYLGDIRTGQHYKLETKPPATSEYIRQEVDFRDRSDTAASNSYKLLDSVINTKGKLTFITAPFEKPIEFNGSFFGSLRTMINKKDMDVSIDVYEQLADGKYLFLSTYLARASYTKDRSKRQLLVPGKTADIPVHTTFFTSRKLQPGSRLLVVLGINKNNGWQINYGTGKDVSTETIQDAGEPLQIRWFNNSYIKIPVWR